MHFMKDAALASGMESDEQMAVSKTNVRRQFYILGKGMSLQGLIELCF
jgi:hypothetical protein